jgi:hypothetical protein
LADSSSGTSTAFNSSSAAGHAEQAISQKTLSGHLEPFVMAEVCTFLDRRPNLQPGKAEIPILPGNSCNAVQFLHRVPGNSGVRCGTSSAIL